MKIGIAGPVTLDRLRPFLDDHGRMPEGYSFPLISDLVLALVAKGHSVDVFALDPTTTELEKYEGAGLTVWVVPMRPRARDRAFDRFAVERRGLSDAMALSQCEIFHAHWSYEFSNAAVSRGRCVAVTAHDSPLRVLRTNRHPYWWVRLSLSYEVLRARGVTYSAVSPSVARDIGPLLRDRHSIRVIPNGVPDSLFRTGLDRLAHGGPVAPDAVPLFATVMQGWSRRKNGAVALRALAELRTAIPEARLVMFGGGYGEGGEAHSWAAERSLCAGVEFAGPQPQQEIHRRLAEEVTAMVHPSLWEACSVAICEAMSLGVPVIGGGSSGGVAWQLEQGRAGVLMDARSPTSVAAAMGAVANDGPLGLELSQAAFESATKRFKLAGMVAAYERWYEEVLGAGAVSPAEVAAARA